MNKSAAEIYSPLMELIEDLYTAPNAERDAIIERLYGLGKKTQTDLERLDLEFQELRKKNGELEEILKELYVNLDKQKAQMQEGDIEYHRIVCSEIYGDFWDLLDDDSQEFFITAHYIYDKIKSKNGDFSPVIIEFCRIFENELQTKIYTDYMEALSKKNPPIVDLNKIYNNLSKAVDDKKRKGTYYLSSTDMINYLAALRFLSDSRTGYNYDMREYLTNRNWDTAMLSDEVFERQSHDYVNNYRNEAAHPNLLDEEVALKCKEKTKKIVKRFIQCGK